MGQGCGFSQKALDRLSDSVYLVITSVGCSGLPESSLSVRADMRHEDKSQDAGASRRSGLAVCLFARL